MITTNLTGNLGNHMWQYSVCRVVAEKLGYEWGINPNPTHDYHQGMNQMYFMDVDFGKKVSGIQQKFFEKWTATNHDSQDWPITMLDPKIFQIQDNTILMGDNGAFGGLFQSEKYFEGVEQKVRDWFKIKQEYHELYQKKTRELNIELDENTCVINFRGGEYRGIPKVVCRKEYWKDSIEHMIKINPNMKFVIISDDIDFAKSYMPFDIPAYHIDIGFDFYMVNQSKWVIISNSSFGWWSAWLNTNANKILAPKYWSCHNISNGFWCIGDSYTKPFTYVDRDGTLSDYESCEKEALDFYKNKGII